MVLFLTSTVCLFLHSQQVVTFIENLQWETQSPFQDALDRESVIPWFKGASRTQYDIHLPVWMKQIPVRNTGQLNVQIRILSERRVDFIDREWIGKDPWIWSELCMERQSTYAVVSLLPLYNQNNATYLIEEFELQITILNEEDTFRPGNLRSMEFKERSILADGDFHKIGVRNSGIVRITHNFLVNTMGIPASQINPGSIKIYGNRGGVLEEEIAKSRVDDLEEIPYLMVDGGDGRFDPNDYILFYGEGSSTYKVREGVYQFQNGIYDEFNYFFITNNNTQRKIFAQANQPSAGDRTFDSYTYYQRLEEDRVNLLDEFISAQGSGKDWYGDYFGGSSLMRQYTGGFNTSGLVNNSQLTLGLAFASRSASSHSISGTFNTQPFSLNIGPVNTSNIEALYARRIVQSVTSVYTGQPEIDVVLRLNPVGQTEGWLDYLEFKGEKELVFQGTPLRFHHTESTSVSRSSYRISNASQAIIWDITDPLQPLSIQSSLIGSTREFISSSAEGLREFIAFIPDASHPLPDYFGRVANQNLHALQEAELAIIYHPDFRDAAIRLRDYKRNRGIVTIAVSTEEVFNEFAGGKRDVTGIREFSRMLYKRFEGYRYLLLIGDASFDYKHINDHYPDHNFVPAYQTRESLHPIEAFPSDDFYGLLSDNEGSDLRGQLEIGVGRLPAKDIREATTMVDKIIQYESDPRSLGDWRLNVGFTADDGDFNTHFRQAERISARTEAKFPLFNQQKVYFDAFERLSTSGGGRYPAATEAINNNIIRGQLVLNYLGHGGPKGWAQERVLQISDVQSWDNEFKLPLLITATCSFTAYDDPKLESAGEISIIRERGGAIGLMTTVRAVFSLENERLTAEVFDTIFSRENLRFLPLGEIMRRAKNNNWQDTIRVNARKFALIADPSMRLGIPGHHIQVTAINDIPIAEFRDTVGAREKIKISGQIIKENGQNFNDFNGTVFPTVFDKKSIISTLGNDPRSRVENFDLYKSILFKGSATVQSGQFSFEFIIPNDINYTPGNGRISLYATSYQNEDAGGYFNQMTIGGDSGTEILDKEGPLIDLFLNDENFLPGGITNPNPTLLIKLFDESGINVTGAGIGHDLVAFLNGDEQNPIILNDFYESEKDNFRAGMVRYPLTGLSPGLNHIRVRAWDVVNNSSESILEFRVVESEDGKIDRLYNFPNPFSTLTEFMFEHDLSGSDLDILIRIYTISGKLIKTIEHTLFSAGNRVNEIYWDGRDDFGDRIGIGVYPYKVLIKDKESGLKRESGFQKLVMIR